MDTLNSWATFIGWVVIIVVILYFILMIIDDNQNKKNKNNERLYNIWTLACKMTLREIYFNNDNVIKDLVKREGASVVPVGGLAMLGLEKSDSEYLAELSKYYGSLPIEAINIIKKNGPPLVLDGNEIKVINREKYLAGLLI